jgi:hypothetical protein
MEEIRHCNFQQYHNNCLKKLSETTEILSQDACSLNRWPNSGPLEHEAGFQPLDHEHQLLDVLADLITDPMAQGHVRGANILLIPVFYVTKSFIIVFKLARYRTVFWARLILFKIRFTIHFHLHLDFLTGFFHVGVRLHLCPYLTFLGRALPASPIPLTLILWQ